jgi:hypothetical protein
MRTVLCLIRQRYGWLVGSSLCSACGCQVLHGELLTQHTRLLLLLSCSFLMCCCVDCQLHSSVDGSAGELQLCIERGIPLDVLHVHVLSPDVSSRQLDAFMQVETSNCRLDT